MLKTISPLLGPELLYVLRAMGHGDELTLVDSNFPSESVGANTTYGSAVRLDGVDVPQAAEAIFPLFPLDSFCDAPILRMEPVDDFALVMPVQQELLEVVRRHSDRDWRVGSIERFQFYERARRSYVVVATGERRPYGCCIFVKGAIAPNGTVM